MRVGYAWKYCLGRDTVSALSVATRIVEYIGHVLDLKREVELTGKGLDEYVLPCETRGNVL